MTPPSVHPSRGLLAALALTLLCIPCGCRILPVSRLDLGLDPRTVNQPKGPEPTAADTPPHAIAANGPQSTRMDQRPSAVPLPPLPLQPMSDTELALADQPTPLLDEALARARYYDQVAVADGSPPQETPDETPASPAQDAATASPPLTTGGDPDQLVLEPPPAPVSISFQQSPASDPGDPDHTQPIRVTQAPAIPAVDTAVTPAAGTAVVDPAVRDANASTPEPASLPENAPSDVWTAGLAELQALAQARADQNHANDADAWRLRAQLLQWMAGSPQPASPDQDEQHPLWPVVLSLLSQATLEAGGGDLVPVGDDDAAMQAALECLEARKPLQVAVLDACQRVQSYGSYETRPLSFPAADSVALYCELDGVAYEADETGYRSRVESRLIVQRPGQETVVWAQDLGVAEDHCRRPRRDYFLHYRIQLPSPKSLPPGPYRLTLQQRDLISGQSDNGTLDFEITAVAP